MLCLHCCTFALSYQNMVAFLCGAGTRGSVFAMANNNNSNGEVGAAHLCDTQHVCSTQLTVATVRSHHHGTPIPSSDYGLCALPPCCRIAQACKRPCSHSHPCKRHCFAQRSRCSTVQRNYFPQVMEVPAQLTSGIRALDLPLREDAGKWEPHLADSHDSSYALPRAKASLDVVGVFQVVPCTNVCMGPCTNVCMNILYKQGLGPCAARPPYPTSCCMQPIGLLWVCNTHAHAPTSAHYNCEHAYMLAGIKCQSGSIISQRLAWIYSCRKLTRSWHAYVLAGS